jgi:hypothetical protein
VLQIHYHPGLFDCFALQKHAVVDVLKVILEMEATVQTNIITLLWMWWDNRNKIRAGDIAGQAERLVMAAVLRG